MDNNFHIDVVKFAAFLGVSRKGNTSTSVEEFIDSLDDRSCYESLASLSLFKLVDLRSKDSPVQKIRKCAFVINCEVNNLLSDLMNLINLYIGLSGKTEESRYWLFNKNYFFNEQPKGYRFLSLLDFTSESNFLDSIKNLIQNLYKKIKLDKNFIEIEKIVIYIADLAKSNPISDSFFIDFSKSAYLDFYLFKSKNYSILLSDSLVDIYKNLYIACITSDKKYEKDILDKLKKLNQKEVDKDKIKKSSLENKYKFLPSEWGRKPTSHHFFPSEWSSQGSEWWREQT